MVVLGSTRIARTLVIFVNIGLNAVWHFFASSHAKNACDGIGGTAKRQPELASLQRSVSEQILTPLQLFKFCVEHIPSVKYFYVSSD